MWPPTTLLQQLNTTRHTLWEQLFEDPKAFKDMRSRNLALGGGGPDFEHRKSGKGLW